MKKPMVWMCAVGLIASAAWAGQARAQAAADPYDKLAAGKSAYEKICSTCHDLGKPNAKTLDARAGGRSSIG